MYCTDCHTSDATSVRGLHGSLYAYVLKRPYTASSASRSMTAGESCFDCHNYDTYANSAAPATVKAYSRFNPPRVEKGHAYHVGEKRWPCFTCHESHGSTARPHLIATGRAPGITSYTETAAGGSCSATCHERKSYSVNYAR
jgi:hypothetical protein